MTLLEQTPVGNSNDSIRSMHPVRERLLHPSGVEVNYVSVFDESQRSETAEMNGVTLDAWDELLAQNSAALPPIFDHDMQTVTPRNSVSEQFYSLAGTQEWGLLMPSARALYYLTHLDDTILPSGQRFAPKATEFMRDMDDGIGIRTRKRIASEIVRGYIIHAEDDVQCLSLACGAADLMLETIATTNNRVFLRLVDTDDASLDLARRIAEDEGLVEGVNYEIVGVSSSSHPEKTAAQRNLLRSMVASNSLVKTLGYESQRVVDAIGINEYFDDKTAARFLANAYSCVEPGGVLLTSNMLNDRSQMNINQVAIGWQNIIKPRSIDDLVAMVQSAGLPLEQTRLVIPEDGIYAVIEVRKDRDAQ
jgi:hypothetical protein